jgi:8-oxo-dGTP pyrophosphatase MutT (NUDIX family)
MFPLLAEYLKKNKRPPLSSHGLPEPRTKAAVLLLAFEQEGKDHLLFNKRTETVAHHKGQICFPGGVQDEIDSSPWATALRETHEEMGITAEQINYVGELGQITTPTGFLITPFVGLLQAPFNLKPNPDEIAEVFTVPLDHFLDAAYLRFVTRNYFGHDYQDPVFTYKHHEIWGATARILIDFLEVWRIIGAYESRP